MSKLYRDQDYGAARPRGRAPTTKDCFKFLDNTRKAGGKTAQTYTKTLMHFMAMPPKVAGPLVDRWQDKTRKEARTRALLKDERYVDPFMAPDTWEWMSAEGFPKLAVFQDQYSHAMVHGKSPALYLPPS